MSNSEHVFAVTDADFQARVLDRSREVPVLVDFWAEWCAPCKMLMPILAGLAEQAGGQWVLAKVDTDAQQQLAQTWQVRSLPTVKLFKDGAVVDEFMGALPESQVLQFLDRHIERDSDRLAKAADARLQAGDEAAALALFDQALAEDPTNSRVVFKRLDALLGMGRAQEVETALDELPIALAEEPEARHLRARTRFERLRAPEPEAATDAAASLRLAAARAIHDGQHQQALELLLQLLTQYPGYQDGVAKDDMLAAFELIDDAELVKPYRRRMFNLLH